MNTILFDADDYRSLQEVLAQFGRFRAGKVKLFEIHTEGEEGLIFPGMIQDQIELNGNLKTEYEVLLDKVLNSFRERIVGLAT